MFFRKSKLKKNEVKYIYRLVSGKQDCKVVSTVGYSKMKLDLDKNRRQGSSINIKDVISGDIYKFKPDNVDVRLVCVESNYFDLELNKKL